MVRVSIFGTGYVGLTTGICLAELGNTVMCYDIDRTKIDMLNKGQLPIYEPGLDTLLDKNREHVSFTSDVRKAVDHGDVIFIAVGTPSSPDGSADLTYVRQVAQDISEHMKSYRVIVDKSTVPVGTAEMVHNIISQSYKGDFDVVSNPEFLKEGTAVRDFLEPDRVVIGADSERARKIMAEVYSKFDRNKIIFTDPRSAELIKYASNTFLAFCISFVNKQTQRYPDANILRVTERMRQEINPHGFFSIGLGFGGSCFPKDVKEFIHTVEKHGVDSKMLREIIEINEKQKTHFIPKLVSKLGYLDDKIVGILGLAFKPDTDDMREAPSINIVNKLMDLNTSEIRVYDPVAMDNARKIFGDDVIYCNSPEDVYNGADALIFVTAVSYTHLTLPTN